MFQYAVCRIVAEYNGYNFWIPPKWKGLKLFPNVNLGNKDRAIKHTFNDTFKQEYKPQIFNIKDNTKLNGFFQSEKYLNREKVKKWFELKPNKKGDEILNKYDINKYCFIHIRGNDYKSSRGGINLDKEYYINAIKKIKEYKSDIKFVSVTDDKKYAKNLLPKIPTLNNHFVADFYVLRYAKYTIISNSSFSWWTSWLNDDNIIIAPNLWLNYNGHKFTKKKETFPKDIISEKFITI